MRELPKYLYHYTSLIRMDWIIEDQTVKPSPSNLFKDDRTKHTEWIYRKRKKVGKRSVDKYANFHPVVWLTANDAAAVENTGLSPAKLQARIVFRADLMQDFILHWPDFTEKYHASPVATKFLKEKNGEDWENWFVCEGGLGLGYADRIEVRDKNGNYQPIILIHRDGEEPEKADTE